MSESNRNLAKVSDGVAALRREIGRIPSFANTVQDCLLAELQKTHPDVFVSKIFINLRSGVSAEGNAKVPLGSLLNVFLECFGSGRSPQYDAGRYAIYEFANSTRAEHILQSPGIAVVEKVIHDVLNDFSNRYLSTVERYWSRTYAKTGTSVRGGSRKAELANVQEKLFWDEMHASVGAFGVTSDDLRSLAFLTQGGQQHSFYELRLEDKNGRYVVLPGAFALPLLDPVQEELIPRGDKKIFLYMPSHGGEVFADSMSLQKALEQRLAQTDSRESALLSLAVEDRSSIPAAAKIRFLKVTGDLFQYGCDSVLTTLKNDLPPLLEALNSTTREFNGAVSRLEEAQWLVDLPRFAFSRHAQIVRSMQKNAWPNWLKKTSSLNQELYLGLEQRLLESQVKFHELTRLVTSLKDYARAAVEEFISPGPDELVDPDTIYVIVTHTVRLADGKRIELKERKTLTQVFMYGAHDEKGQFAIEVVGKTDNPKLSSANILRAIKQLNIRNNYIIARAFTFADDDVVESLREVLGRKTALSIFSAVVQRQVTSIANDMVMRYNFGDNSIETKRLAAGWGFGSCKDLVVYRRRGIPGDRDLHVLNVPGFPSGQEWFQFADIDTLRGTVFGWLKKPDTAQYFERQGYFYKKPLPAGETALPQPTILFDGQMSDAVELRNESEKAPLQASAKNLVRCENDEIELATPRWYRRASVDEQCLYNRLNSDHKALYEASKEKLEIIPFKRFSSDLVKKTVTEYLNRTGIDIDINPDEVWVKFHAQSKISLTELFIQWQMWRADVSIFEKLFLGGTRLPIGGDIDALKDQMRQATFWSFSNQPIAALNARLINDLIDLMPGEKYLAYIRSKFLEANDVSMKVELYRRVKQNEMYRAVLLQKMKGELTQDQLDWLTGLINGLDNDLPRLGGINTGQPPGNGVWEFTLEGRKLEGAYVFSRTANGRQESIIYVPNTYNGKDFFPVEQLADQLKNSFFKKDILKVTRSEHLEVIQNVLATYLHYKPGVTPAPVLRNSYQVRSFQQQYKEMIQRFIADVDYQTTSPSEELWKDAKILIDFALDVASMFIPPLGLAVSVLRITHSVIQGVMAASLGNDEKANELFASAWRGAIMLYVGKVAGIGSPVNPLAMLSTVRDIADLVSAVTGVPVGISYITSAIASPPAVDGTVRILG